MARRQTHAQKMALIHEALGRFWAAERANVTASELRVEIRQATGVKFGIEALATIGRARFPPWISATINTPSGSVTVRYTKGAWRMEPNVGWIRHWQKDDDI